MECERNSIIPLDPSKTVLGKFWIRKNNRVAHELTHDMVEILVGYDELVWLIGYGREIQARRQN